MSIYVTPAVVSFLTPHVVSYSAHLDSFFIRGVKPRREGRREGQPLSPSLPPGVDSSDAKMIKKEHCMTPKPGSKVTPQLGSYICSFLVNYTSEKSTPEPLATTLTPSWRYLRLSYYLVCNYLNQIFHGIKYFDKRTIMKCQARSLEVVIKRELSLSLLPSVSPYCSRGAEK